MSAQNDILFIGFNQDSSRVACGTNMGFAIYNCNPYKNVAQRVDNQKGIGYIEMLGKTNIMALVGGGNNPLYPPTKVMIWDDKQGKCMSELIYKQPVLGIKLTRDRIITSLENITYMYNLTDLKLLESIRTYKNPHGCCAISSASGSPNGSSVAAFMGPEVGTVRVDLYNQKKTHIIQAHQTSVVYFTLNNDGTLLATASEQGTLIRIFNTATGDKLKEFRRGSSSAEIHSIAFNKQSTFIAVTSNRGTVHMFPLEINTSDELSDQLTVADNGSGLTGMIPFSGYFRSEWSTAKFTIPDFDATHKSIVAFDGDNETTLTVVCTNGTLRNITFNDIGECTENSKSNFTDQ
jgi:WD40 repeat protein